jgi:hypothetical protein
MSVIETTTVEQRNAEITRRGRRLMLAAERRQRRKKASRPSIATLRTAELTRLFHTRYGSSAADDDAGREDVQIMVNHLIVLADGKLRVRDWCRKSAPWMSENEVEDLIAKTITRPWRWKADTLERLLNLTDVERSRLSIRTIGAVDCTKDQRAAKRRERDRQSKQLKRRAGGAKPQAQSVNRQQPWLGLGISRATYFRRMRQFQPQYKACVNADEVVSATRRAQRPARIPRGLSCSGRSADHPWQTLPSMNSPSRAATKFDRRSGGVDFERPR